MSTITKKQKIQLAVLSLFLCGAIVYQFVWVPQANQTKLDVESSAMSLPPAPVRVDRIATTGTSEALHQPGISTSSLIEPTPSVIVERAKRQEASIAELDAMIAESKSKAELARLAVVRAKADLAEMAKPMPVASSGSINSPSTAPQITTSGEKIRPEDFVVVNSFSGREAMITVLGQSGFVRAGTVFNGVSVLSLDGKSESVKVRGVESGKTRTHYLSATNSRQFVKLEPISKPEDLSVPLEELE